jgi:transposase
MLDEAKRTAILKLGEEGHGARTIACSLGLSRNAVRRVLAANIARPPELARAEKAEPYRAAILELYAECRGNLIRVHEELVKQGATLSYPALTGFCRRHALIKPAPLPVGHYDFAPGEEMQHDTSPHDVRFTAGVRRVQTASAVLAYSRMIFVQMYPRFARFHCKTFLTEAMKYFGGACGRCVIDNTHVVVLSGTGREMKAVPEMEAFAGRFSFVFMAHEKGDADRKGRVERPFHYIENNFLAGREFTDFADLNIQARAWCDEKNAAFRRHLHATPRELFVTERPFLKPLPLWIPDPYVLHERIVSVDGYVTVNAQLYSAPYQLIGRRMEVRESRDKIAIYDGARLVGTHAVAHDSRPKRITDPAHRPARGAKEKLPLRPEEDKLLAALPGMAEYIARLKRRAAGQGTLALRRLMQIVEEYPRDAVLKALAEAAQYGLYDPDRLERMVLRNVKNDFFQLHDECAEGTK